MKLLKISVVIIIVLSAVLFGIREYNYRNASKEAKILYHAESSIESYLKLDMHDPSSLELELTSLPLQLDTISNKELFPNKREYYLIRANLRGNNVLGAKVLNESVFYVTDNGDCIYSQDIEKLTSEERSWLLYASIESYK